MRLLHTSDWHLGKVLKGFSRIDEQRRVMAEIVALAASERIDAVLVAGDVFETASPSTEAQQLAWSTIMALRSTGAEVLVIAGNHDNAEMFDAVKPVFAAAGVHIIGRTAAPGSGGVVELDAGGELLRVAMVPFVSQRAMVRAADLFGLDGGEMALQYADWMSRLVGALTAGFTPDAVNVVLCHAFVRGGMLGGGERDAQTVHAYSLPAQVFPSHASYVALGHLHRSQELPGPCPIHYPGSPFAVDFGEETDRKSVLLVDAAPGRPVVVRRHELTAPRVLRTVEGSLAELTDQAPSFGDDLLRVLVTDAPRAGLAADVRAVLPNALEVRLRSTPGVGASPTAERRLARAPEELFGEYLEQHGVEDDRLRALFRELHDAESSAARSVVV